MEPGSFQWCPVTEQEAVCANERDQAMENITGRPWSLHPWTLQKPSGHGPLATGSRSPRSTE